MLPEFGTLEKIIWQMNYKKYNLKELHEIAETAYNLHFHFLLKDILKEIEKRKKENSG